MPRASIKSDQGGHWRHFPHTVPLPLQHDFTNKQFTDFFNYFKKNKSVCSAEKIYEFISGFQITSTSREKQFNVPRSRETGLNLLNHGLHLQLDIQVEAIQAILRCHPELATARLELKIEDKLLLLHKAAQKGYDLTLQFSMNCGLNVNFRDTKGKTALFYAAKNRQINCAKILLNYGALLKDKEDVCNVLNELKKLQKEKNAGIEMILSLVIQKILEENYKAKHIQLKTILESDAVDDYLAMLDKQDLKIMNLLKNCKEESQAELITLHLIKASSSQPPKENIIYDICDILLKLDESLNQLDSAKLSIRNVLTKLTNDEAGSYLDALKPGKVGKLLKESSYSDAQKITFMKYHLILAARNRNSEIVQQICGILRVDFTKESSDIIHFKDPVNEYWKKTALNCSNENEDTDSAREILMIERIVHKTKTEGLDCLKDNLDKGSLLTWIISTLQKHYSHTSKILTWIVALTVVAIETIGLSYMMSAFDIYSDFQLLGQYKQYAFNKTINVTQTIFDGTHFTNRNNFTCGTNFTNDVLQEDFHVAYGITWFFLASLGFVYVASIFTAPTSKSVERLKDKNGFSHPTVFIINFLYKLFWPVSHVVNQIRYNVAEKKTNYQEDVNQDHSVWRAIHLVEQGVENVGQLLLSIWLLRYYLPFLTNQSISDNLDLGLNGVLNFISFGQIKAIYLEQAVGKIIMSTLSLTLSLTWMKLDKPGMGILEKLWKSIPLLLSHAIQIIGRILAFACLIFLDTHTSTFIKYMIFFFSHSLLTAVFVFIFTVGRSKNTCNCNQKTKKVRTSSLIFISLLSSMVVFINTSDSIKKKYTFLVHSMFQIIILLENTALMTLPLLLEWNYPILDCFDETNRDWIYTLPWVAVGSWAIAAVLQMIHYSCAHPWSAVNGPRLEEDNSGTFFATCLTCSMKTRVVCARKVQVITCQPCCFGCSRPCCNKQSEDEYNENKIKVGQKDEKNIVTVQPPARSQGAQKPSTVKDDLPEEVLEENLPTHEEDFLQDIPSSSRHDRSEMNPMEEIARATPTDYEVDQYHLQQREEEIEEENVYEPIIEKDLQDRRNYISEETESIDEGHGWNNNSGEQNWENLDSEDDY